MFSNVHITEEDAEMASQDPIASIKDSEKVSISDGVSASSSETETKTETSSSKTKTKTET